jgi:hypothetical protein
MTSGSSNESKAGNGNRVPSGDEEWGIVRALRGVEGGGYAAGQQPCDCTGKGRFRRCGVA